MGMLPGAEGVTVNIELSINRCWPRTRECHCHCGGAVVQWSCMRWSCGQTRSAGWWRRVKAAVSRFPWVKVPLIGPEHSIRLYSPSYPRQAAAAGHAASPQSWIQRRACLSYTARDGVQQRSMEMAIFRHEHVRPRLDYDHSTQACAAVQPVRLSESTAASCDSGTASCWPTPRPQCSCVSGAAKK